MKEVFLIFNPLHKEDKNSVAYVAINLSCLLGLAVFFCSCILYGAEIPYEWGIFMEALGTLCAIVISYTILKPIIK